MRRATTSLGPPGAAGADAGSARATFAGTAAGRCDGTDTRSNHESGGPARGSSRRGTGELGTTAPPDLRPAARGPPPPRRAPPGAARPGYAAVSDHPVPHLRQLASHAGAAPPKIARLARLCAAGLPVPPAVVVPPPPPADLDPADRAAARNLLRDGPVVVRTALAAEDAAAGSFAGLGPHVPHVETPADLEATLARLRSPPIAAETTAYADLLGLDPPGACWIFVQRKIDRRHLYVLATLPGGAVFAERYDGAGAVLARGEGPADAFVATPREAGPPGALARCAARVAQVVPPGRFGLEIEVCEDVAGRLWVVQARPLSRRLAQDAGAFFDEVARRGETSKASGLLQLDAEHNPAPLSFAHAALIDRLRARRPDAGGPVVLAGYLYVRTPPRDLRPPAAAPPDPRATLERLRTAWIPALAGTVAALERRLAGAGARAVARAIDEALAAFDDMIDRYLDVLVPARRAATARAPVEAATFALDGRERFAHVLPAAWDVASAPLAQAPAAGPPPRPPPDDAAVAVHLAEWDDHLFALGLAAVRAVYRAAARVLKLGAGEVFALSPAELRGALETGHAPADLLAQRREADARARRLVPPLRICGTTPLPPAPGGRLRGVGVGPGFEGVVTPRRDLADLAARPPADPRRAVVVLPALLAQASIVLARLGVRAVVTEHGGALSHGVVLARELGLAAVVGCPGALDLPEGAWVRLDTRRGRVRPATAPNGQDT